MAKKPVPNDEALEGDRLPDEAPAPADDSHLIMDMGSPIEGTPVPEENRGTPETPALVTVQVGNLTVDMTTEQAAEYHAQERQYRDALQAPAPTPDPTPPADDSRQGDPNFEDLIFTDPNAAMALMRDSIKTEVREEMRTEYNQDQQQRDFWSNFYLENKELKEDDGLVKVVLQDNWNSLQNLTDKAGRDKLAELTQAKILGYVNKHGSKSGGKVVSLEGESPAPPGSPAPSADDPVDIAPKVTSLGDAIKERRKRRHASKAS